MAKVDKIIAKENIKNIKREQKAHRARIKADEQAYKKERAQKAKDARYAREDKIRRAKDKAAERRYKFAQKVSLGSQAISSARDVLMPHNALVTGSSTVDPEQSADGLDMPQERSPW